METRNLSRNSSGPFRHASSALLAVLLSGAGAHAQVTTVVEAGGHRVELQGSAVRCALDGSGLHCTASAGAGAADLGRGRSRRCPKRGRGKRGNRAD